MLTTVKNSGILLLLFLISWGISQKAQAGELDILNKTLFLKPRDISITFPLGKVSNLNQTPPAAISPNAAPFLKSLLVPGWGQYSQKRNKMALVFFGCELVFWSGIYGVKTYGTWLENDYKAFAVLHAGINPSGKNHDFYVDLGNYDNQDEYNQAQQISRNYDVLYLGEEYYWDWDSSANRNAFENLRIQADTFKNSAIFFAGAILVNHIVSAIEAARQAKRITTLNAGFTITQQGNGMITIIKEF
jgi:hypothetical protein